MKTTLKNANQKFARWSAENPIQAVVVCAAAGYLVGCILRSVLES